MASSDFFVVVVVFVFFFGCSWKETGEARESSDNSYLSHLHCSCYDLLERTCIQMVFGTSKTKP